MENTDIQTSGEQSVDLFAMDESLNEEITEDSQSLEPVADESVTEEVATDETETLSDETEDKSVEAYRKLQSERDTAVAQLNKAMEILNQTQKQPESSIESEEVMEAPIKPLRPDKPANFSRYEANNDPESESAKYLDALEDYQAEKEMYEDEVMEYNQYLQKQQIQQQQATEQRKQQIYELGQRIMTEKKYTQEQAVDFLQWAANPQPSLPTLLAIYEKEKGITSNPSKPIASKTAKPPLPAGAGSGFTTPPVTTENAFEASLGATDRRRKDLFQLS